VEKTSRETVTLFITTNCEEETMALGERLGTVLRGGDVVLLDGDLGAGKTRFVKGVAKALGVKEAVTSPTFNLVLEYPVAVCSRSLEESCDTSARRSIHAASAEPTLLRHFDLYRLEHPEQLGDLDYFGLIEEPCAISLVEWGSKFPSELPLEYILVTFTVAAGNPEQRLIELSAEGAFAQELLDRMILAEGVCLSG
jgi:tRNA threonylcarbamoyladenosine biosynthesis protein TsaE